MSAAVAPLDAVAAGQLTTYDNIEFEISVLRRFI